MTSLRYRLECQLWRAGVKVAVLPGEKSAQVTRYPLLLGDATSIDVDRALGEVTGRLNLGGLRGVWRDDGLYSLEVARHDRATITLADIKPSNGAHIPWLLGVTTSGKALTIDLAQAPHLLIAGTTGSGKSNHIVGALASLVTRQSPEAVRLCLIDPKRVDMLAFAGCPHTLAHVTNSDSFADVLSSLCTEMQKRYALFECARVRNLDAYNAQGNALPRIVCVFDEAASAVTANQALEPLVLELLQTARASGIHLVMAMQRPSAAVLTPTARLNLPLRVAFRVLDANSSRLIINSPDAAGLLGDGDGLLLGNGNTLTRFQSPLVSDKDLSKATEAARAYPAPAFSLDGLSGEATTPTIDPSLPPLEQAKKLLESFADIRSSDLIKAGIVGSSTPAKALLSELRALGYVGDYDPSTKASKVLTSPDFGTYPRDGEAATGRIHATGETTSPTQKDGKDGLSLLQLRAVN